MVGNHEKKSTLMSMISGNPKKSTLMSIILRSWEEINIDEYGW
jgi:hypothetical protein